MWEVVGVVRLGLGSHLFQPVRQRCRERAQCRGGRRLPVGQAEHQRVAAHARHQPRVQRSSRLALP
jgi:hypothetical protein